MKVRNLKSSGVDKKVWQPEVVILLDLKKKLATATGATPAPAGKQPKLNQKEQSTAAITLTDSDKIEIKKLEDEIEKQVRILIVLHA